jgi:3-hydroxyisobutyrate dehydrogenase-like beta-hydroxyacid dehydrogenase
MGLRIGVIGTGEMGAGVGGHLVAHGAEVWTTLAGRSAASAERVGRAGITVVDGLEPLARACSVVLSILPPDRALVVAEAFAGAARGSGGRPLYVDCNSIAPETARRIGEIVTAAGARFADASIIGAPPRAGHSGPRIYACGPHVAEVEALTAYGLEILPLAGPIGVASALKMCWAGIGKAYIGIGAAIFAQAERNGIAEELMGEFTRRPHALTDYLPPATSRMYRKAYRWIGEMREIETFCASAEPGVPSIYDGLAEYYTAIAETETVNEPA